MRQVRSALNEAALAAMVLMLPHTVGAQDPVRERSVPFKVDQRHMSGLDLPKRDLKLHPGKEFYQRRIYHGEDLSVFVLGGETIRNVQKDFPMDEFIIYLNGYADIAAAGRSFRLLAGDYAVGPKGWAGTWTNHGVPRFNLELSVISTIRSPQPGTAKAPFRLDRQALAGVRRQGHASSPFSQVLYEGPEIKVSLAIQPPTSRRIEGSSAETFFHILSGSVTIKAIGSPPKHFYVGDNFVLPSGFAGDWTVEGSNGARFISVVAQDALKNRATQSAPKR
ncbi:MAG: cupin domain-containing protein [Myxococcota bacterium]